MATLSTGELSVGDAVTVRRNIFKSKRNRKRVPYIDCWRNSSQCWSMRFQSPLSYFPRLHILTLPATIRPATSPGYNFLPAARLVRLPHLHLSRQPNHHIVPLIVGWTPVGTPRPRSRSEGAIRATLTRTPSASSLLRARQPMRVGRRRNARAGETGDPREGPPTSGSDPVCSRASSSSLTTRPLRPPTIPKDRIATTAQLWGGGGVTPSHRRCPSSSPEMTRSENRTWFTSTAKLTLLQGSEILVIRYQACGPWPGIHPHPLVSLQGTTTAQLWGGGGVTPSHRRCPSSSPEMTRSENPTWFTSTAKITLLQGSEILAIRYQACGPWPGIHPHPLVSLQGTTTAQLWGGGGVTPSHRRCPSSSPEMTRSENPMWFTSTTKLTLLQGSEILVIRYQADSSTPPSVSPGHYESPIVGGGGVTPSHRRCPSSSPEMTRSENPTWFTSTAKITLLQGSEILAIRYQACGPWPGIHPHPLVSLQGTTEVGRRSPPGPPARVGISPDLLRHTGSTTASSRPTSSDRIIRENLVNKGLISTLKFLVRLLPGFSHVRNVLYDTAGRQVFSGISGGAPYPPCFILIGSEDLVVKSLPHFFDPTFEPLVHMVFDTSWRTLAQSSPSTVAADNQCTIDTGIFVHKSVESSLQSGVVTSALTTAGDASALGVEKVGGGRGGRVTFCHVASLAKYSLFWVAVGPLPNVVYRLFTAKEALLKALPNRIRLERASREQSSDTHKTPYDRVTRRRELRINIKASERVNVDVFTQNKRLCLQHSYTPFFQFLHFSLKHGFVIVNMVQTDCTPVRCFARRGDKRVDAHVSVAPSAPTLLGPRRAQKFLQPGGHLNSEVLKVDEGEARRIPEKTHPAASSGTIPTCEIPGATPPRIEPGSPSWEASSLTTPQSRPRPIREAHTRYKYDSLSRLFPGRNWLNHISIVAVTSLLSPRTVAWASSVTEFRTLHYLNDYGSRLQLSHCGFRRNPREDPPTSGIVRHDSHERKSGSDPAGNRTWFTLVGDELSDHYTSAAPFYHVSS
ncbi:hypothetical protein PR048_007570 [Dryococelus australis]|uniref:Uncharacterized protein n=1 Tax=Dryococelus australis TaxID=614101 RepID=A0ABQ9HW99_9NEOP|nr:hypothetical protein PR048_007570 [Dryococelus australis]